MEILYYSESVKSVFRRPAEFAALLFSKIVGDINSSFASKMEVDNGPPRHFHNFVFSVATLAAGTLASGQQ